MNILGTLGIDASTLTAPALLGVVVVLILFGILVPRRTLRDVAKERDQWKQAHDERSRQLSEVLTGVRTASAYIEATAKVAQEMKETRE